MQKYEKPGIYLKVTTSNYLGKDIHFKVTT